MKKVTAIVLLGAFGFAGCSGEHHLDPDKARATARFEWESLTDLDQEIACNVFNDPAIDADTLIDTMTDGPNPDSKEVAEAKITILTEAC